MVGTDPYRKVHRGKLIKFCKPIKTTISAKFHSPPRIQPTSSSSPRRNEDERSEDQRPPKRIRTIQSQSPERHRGQLAKRGKKKKGRRSQGTRQRAETEAGSDEDDEDDDVEEPPEDYQAPC